MGESDGSDREIRVAFTAKKPPLLIVLLICLGLTVFVGIMDFISGYEISFSIFYIIPVTIAVFFAGFPVAILISVLCAASWFLADVQGGHVYSNTLVPVWNASMRFSYFLLHSFLFSRFIKLYQNCKHKSITDTLTLAVNAEFFYQLAGRELARARRSHRPLTLAYLDLDNFKAVNDSLGHLTGDDLLQTLANVMRQNIRPVDVLGRLGGDEFAVLLPDADRTVAAVVLERIREKAAEAVAAKGWPVTLSMGAVTFVKPDIDVRGMVKRADDLMYLAKKSGKNRIEYETFE